ncbi:MAG: glycosyltransferase family 2 protein [Planctomycetota bacterium]|jgi:glycosyltransferase involved in cell wall biosynthesis
MPPKISICILAQDEADKIEFGLKSIKACDWCDELLVFDSGSTDGTVSICEQYADRVQHEPWVDFSTNRQKIVAAAKNDWVFILDADEEISEGLAREIANLDDGLFEKHPVFTMPRNNYLLGRHIRAWDPDRIDRLFDRTRVRWPDRAIHDFREPTEGTVQHLAGPIIHNRHADNWSDYFDGNRYAKRTDALAHEMYDRGKRVGFLGLYLRPWAAFVKFYFLKRGFLSGSAGLLIAQKAAFSVQLKYARLWDLQRRAKKSSGGD